MDVTCRAKRKTKPRTCMGNGSVVTHNYNTRLSLRIRSRKVVAYLPIEIIFDILVRLPATTLHEVMRYVCWDWHNMVKEPAFVAAHHPVSPIGVLVQRLNNLYLAHYVEVTNTRFKITEFKLPFPAKVCNSCNGLVLLENQDNSRVCHILNLVTRANIVLPLLPCTRAYDFSRYNSIIACTSDGKHKVICVMGGNFSELVQILVFTVGNDHAWRVIEHTASKGGKNLLLHGTLNSVAGFVYWRSNYTFFALDVNAEVTYESDIIGEMVEMDRSMGLLRLTYVGGGRYVWRLWELTDLKSGNFTQMFDLDFGPIWSTLRDAYSWKTLLFLRNEELWLELTRTDNYALVVFNTRKVNVLVFRPGCDFRCFPHVNSLMLPETRSSGS